ncbi:MAG: lactate racemase domain-containing protein [Propionibacteriaceae bacterium]|nr:lactate racemase domain-containing protein [Propionibacteriaceae bacterium]
MARPGFVLEVDDKTPPLMTPAGAELRLERLGIGTRVVYPADAVASSDPTALIESALTAPLNAQSLASRIRPGTKLTLVIADDDPPFPRPQFDPRRTLVERVLESAARAGVDDVELVVANGLRQRWSPAQITSVLGDRVATSFLPDGLITSHDVTSEDLVTIGEVDGAPVQLNRRVAESDLVVVIGLASALTAQCPVAGGLTDLATINRMYGAHAAPGASAAVEDLVARHVDAFSLVAVLGQPLLGPAMRFVSKREWEWNLGDKLSYAGARQIVAAMPRNGASLVHNALSADYAIIDVVAGDPTAVRRDASRVWQAANAVEVAGAADVLVTPVWGAAIEEGPIGSPLDAAHHALVTAAGSHLGSPFVREGGVLIGFHPLPNKFSNRRQSAAADFFAKVLPASTDPAEIAAEFEPKAIADDWYLDLYRKQFAHHPLRVYHQWYRTAEAARNLSNVIWVGGDRRSAALLGHRAASTYADALEIASDVVGNEPAITFLRGPGLALGDVR